MISLFVWSFWTQRKRQRKTNPKSDMTHVQ